MLDDLMKSMMEGSGTGSGDQAAGDPLADLLGNLVGGDAASGSGDVSDLLGGLLGAGSDQGAGDAGDLLGSLMGGAGADIGAGSPLAPMIQGIAEKVGLPPQMAQLIVTFLLGKLLSAGAGGGLDLNDLLGRMGSGQGLDADYVQATGLAEELSQQTGLDSDTATRGLQEALNLLGGQLGGQ
jgi:hypothetical protein